MITGRFTGVLLVALWLSLPAGVLAEEKHAPFRPRSSLAPPRIAPHQPLGPAIGYHRYSPPPAQSHGGDSRQGMKPLQHSYPHGHRLHAHGPWCAVGIAPHVHVVHVPVWRVSFYPQSFRTGQAMLQILVTAAEGEIYVDDQYVGAIASLQGSALEFAVWPGWHVVYVVHRGNTYSHAVDAEVDFTAVVQANLP